MNPLNLNFKYLKVSFIFIRLPQIQIIIKRKKYKKKSNFIKYSLRK